MLAGSGTEVVPPFGGKMREKFSSQSSVNSSVWWCSSGSSPFTPRYTSTAPGPAVALSQYACG
ncbi:hypothetical protein BC477_06320 [Clavibacter michiganensis subsp. michiganensis]|uniref:Uncharacterized protein n=1 Tax=Clavibacter michiganensis subsp. michiganensis TaxID=33013 RepID=A0A251XLH2_CLAMM|nr:hypothetical protein BC477_06320 [Clavibacter michiganensis subsp. michiganensis]OUE04332.1 hypothetical protein CMMCAS07_05250 [Clavibacter michiganensis subsp. michiganensis]